MPNKFSIKYLLISTPFLHNQKFIFLFYISAKDKYTANNFRDKTANIFHSPSSCNTLVHNTKNHDTAALGDTAGTTGGDTTDGNAGQSITGGNTTGTAGGNKNSGTIQKPAATPKPMTKPSTPKPGTTKPSATPAPTATPVPAATPAPAQSNDNSSSGGSSDSGSTGGDSGSSGGSDVDMEWTPDLL